MEGISFYFHFPDIVRHENLYIHIKKEPGNMQL